jgi:hypothetical protein
MSIEYGVLICLCSRSREIVIEAGASPVLVGVYQTAIEQPLGAF